MLEKHHLDYFNLGKKENEKFWRRLNEKPDFKDKTVLDFGCGHGALAIEIAKQEGLDLIEISPNANPPVCKIMDMGKYKYDLQKKANQAKKKQKIVSLKEIKLRPETEIHDYNFKIKNAKEFITKGDKVKFTVKFKGREMQHVELGKKLMNRIIEDTKDIGKVETQPKFEGRQMIMIIQPI